ncbi:MAG: ABC transporter permease [Bryobacteraceae bacterium]
MALLRIALINIARRRLRTSLTLCGIAVGVSAFVALVGFSKSFEREWLKLYQSEGTDLAVVQRTFLNTTVDESAGDKIRALPVVAEASPVVINLMDLTPEVNALAYGLAEDSYEMAPLQFLEGRTFRGEQAEVILGEVLAGNLGKKAGDEMEIQGASFRVAGVFRGGSALETGAVMMPIRQLQKLADLNGKVTAFHVRLRPAPAGQTAEEHLRQARAAIEKAVPGLKAVPAGERAHNNQFVSFARSIAWGTSLIALLAGALGIANTMAMAVFERTREIGILRALGWRRWRVMALIQWEAAALGLIGGMAGLAGGWGALRLLAALPMTANIAVGSISPLHAGEALAIALLTGLAAGALPAWRAARLSPVEALRHD